MVAGCFWFECGLLAAGVVALLHFSSLVFFISKFLYILC